jgi:hypothetical protein
MIRVQLQPEQAQLFNAPFESFSRRARIGCVSWAVHDAGASVSSAGYVSIFVTQAEVGLECQASHG